MSVARLARPRATVPPRFRCLVCRVFVTGGEDGTCPRCGWAPPGVAPAGRAPRTLVVPGWLAAMLILLGLAGAIAVLAL